MRVWIIAMLLPMLSAASAQPVVDRVTPTSRSEVRLQGSDFGAGPRVVLYDDFSAASVDGENLTLRPLLGEWYRTRDRGALEQGAFGPESRSLVGWNDTGLGTGSVEFGVVDPEGVHGLEHFQEIYISRTLRDLGAFPGANECCESFSPTSSSKHAWMMFGRRGDNTRYSVDVLGEPSGHDLVLPSWIGATFSIAGNQTSMRPRYYQRDLEDFWDFGGWVAKMFHGKLNPADPYGDAEGFFAFINRNGYFVNPREGRMMTDQTDEGVPYPYWDRVKISTWRRSSEADVKRVMDEVYVAIGSNANARVLLADSPALHSATRIKHLLPSRWSDDEIVLTMPKNSVGAAEFIHSDRFQLGRALGPVESVGSYYLHVITADNQHAEAVAVGAL